MKSNSIYQELLLDQTDCLVNKDLFHAFLCFLEDAKTANLNLGSETKSIFYLVRKHLDKPFRAAFLIDARSKLRDPILPSSLSTLPRGSSLEVNNRKPRNFNEALSILKVWRTHLKDLETTANPNDEVLPFQILTHLSYYLAEFKPATEQLELDSGLSESRPTRSHAKVIDSHCELCCRKTELALLNDNEAKRGVSLTPHQLGPSHKFCSIHKPEWDFRAGKRVGPGWNYMKARSKKVEVERELLSILNPETSIFLPNFNWFATYIPNLTKLERKKIAILLVNSKLNSKAKKEIRYNILRNLALGFSRKNIAKQTGLTKSSIDKHIRLAVSEIVAILSYPYLDEEGENIQISPFQGPPFKSNPMVKRQKEVWKLVNSCLFVDDRKKRRVPNQVFRKIGRALPQVPNLDIILDGVRGSL